MATEEEVTRYDTARRRLVNGLVRERTIRDSHIEAAFRAVPRELFVPPARPEEVYSDTTIPVTGAEGGWLTTSSQPGMMALMLEQLRAKPGESILEIGAGTGYNAAILSRIVGSDGSVHSVEIEIEAAAGAAEALRRAGCPATVHVGDGAEGWASGAPYHRILATVAVWDLPGPWIAQVRPEGRIVAPLSVVGGEYSMALERDGDAWVSRTLEPCSFVRFKGRLAHPDTRLALGEPGQPALLLSSEPAQMPPPEAVHAWLQNGRGRHVDTFGAGEWDGFLLHLLARHGPLRVVRAHSAGQGLGWKGQAAGLWDERGLALVSASGRLENFGAGHASDTLKQHLAKWNALGRPDIADFRFRLKPESLGAGPARLPRFRHTLLVEGAAR